MAWAAERDEARLEEILRIGDGAELNDARDTGEIGAGDKRLKEMDSEAVREVEADAERVLDEIGVEAENGRGSGWKGEEGAVTKEAEESIVLDFASGLCSELRCL